MPHARPVQPRPLRAMTEAGKSAALAFVITLAAAPAVLVLLQRWKMVDHPNDRSSHARPTPRGLGLAPFIGTLTALLLFPVADGNSRTGLLIAATGFGALGLIEDVVGVAPLPRLLGQLVLAVICLTWLLEELRGPPIWQVTFAIGCAVWLAAYVNAFNFMDGINGIAAAQVLVATGAWWTIGRAEGVPALASPSFVLGAATLAFAPFNFPRAYAFLGDVGSYFLGACLAAQVIIGLRASLPPEAVVAPLSLYLADTATTIVRRARGQEVWYLPHRSHVYQRLTQPGRSHTLTTVAVAGTMALVSALGALSLCNSFRLHLAGDVGIFLVLAAYLASPTLLLRRPSSTAAIRPPASPRSPDI